MVVGLVELAGRMRHDAGGVETWQRLMMGLEKQQESEFLFLDHVVQWLA